jgi:hypothetical protein
MSFITAQHRNDIVKKRTIARKIRLNTYDVKSFNDVPDFIFRKINIQQAPYCIHIWIS